MADISFDVGGCKFNYRVAAIIECHQRYLFTTAPGTDFWFLPGGRVKAGESSLEAIKRELQEELRLENQVMPLDS
ncbi:MAG: NUDIX domain-containing protein [Anaerolineae bacterium]|nr:NUDIX domain-containing protein [Anaerolineae bacterium]